LRCERPPASAGVAVSCARPGARSSAVVVTWRQRASSILAVAVLLLAAATAFEGPRSAAAAEPLDSACEAIRDVARQSADVTLGVVVVDLRSGDRCALNESRPFRTASLYKTVVAAELYRQVAEGLVALDDTITVQPRHHVDDPPALRPSEAYTVSVYEAADRMIIASNNGTAFALRELLGESTVDAATEWLGMPATTLATAFLTSPEDQARLYMDLYHGRVVNHASSAAIMDMLRRQQVRDAIPQGVPAGVVVAHKTGTLEGYLHDAGIVYAPGGDLVLVVMTENEDFGAALEAIQAVAAAAYLPYASDGQPLLSAQDAFWSESAPGASLPYVRSEAAEGGSDMAAATGAVTGVQVTDVQVTDGGAAGMVAGDADPEVIPTLVIGNGAGDGLPLVETLRDPLVLGSILGLTALAVGLPVMVLRRKPRVRYGTETLTGAALALPQSEARLRADRSERGLVMRFGSRRDGDGRSEPASPASRSVAEVAQQPVLPSKRLQRVAEHFRAQGELLTSMRDQFEEEMEPLHDLIVKQAQAMQSLLQNLEERLRPLNEYADGEEANLSALEERIQAGGQDHVARSFSQYLEEQRSRISETRVQIDQQRVPFLEYGDAQRDTVEAALSRFDNDIEALEANLADQRRVMVRMLDAMRSETFGAVREYLDGRQQALAQMAASGSTDPGEIGRAVAALRRSMEEIAGKSDYVRGLLQHAEMADRALIEAAPAPRPLRQEAPAVAVVEDEDDEAGDEVSA